MADNIIDLIQQRLNYPNLQQIDPNTQERRNDQQKGGGFQKLVQAAVPAVLVALQKYLQKPGNMDSLLKGSSPSGWLDAIFGTNKQTAIQKIAEYSGTITVQAEREMEKVADEAVIAIRENIPKNAKAEDVTTYLGNQKSSILSRLPAALQIGDLLGDDTVDDRTHKMQGPISSLMHKIEDSFSGSTTKSDDKDKK